MKTSPVIKTSEAATDTEVSTEVATAYFLRQVAERLAYSLASALKPFDQNTSAYRVLIALTRKNPSSMRELIESTLIPSSTLSRTVEALENEGCVATRALEDDARARQVTLTPDGESRLALILPAAEAQYNWSIRDIPPEDIRVMHETLKKMLQNLKTSPIK